MIRIRITEGAVARADSLAWEHGLRGYDAVQLAAALLWHEAMGDSVTLATFDLSLWSVVEHEGLVPFPTDLPASLKNWQKLKS